MSRKNTYAKPTTTNCSFLKIPVNMDLATETAVTWGQILAYIPKYASAADNAQSPIKAIKLGAITVGGSPEAPAHLEFKGGQTFDLPALATKPMRVHASEKNLYVSGWRRISVDGSSVYSNTDDDNLTTAVVFKARGQVAYIEVAVRFYDDAGYRTWTTGSGSGLGTPSDVRYLVTGPTHIVAGAVPDGCTVYRYGPDMEPQFSPADISNSTGSFWLNMLSGRLYGNTFQRQEYYDSITNWVAGSYVTQIAGDYPSVWGSGTQVTASHETEPIWSDAQNAYFKFVLADAYWFERWR